nr:YpjP family protein [Evansella caseinilytica]
MKLWFRKISVILITFMTLGVFIPPTYLDAHAERNEVVSSTGDVGDVSPTVPEIVEEEDGETAEADSADADTGTSLLTMFKAQAAEQTLYKLGPKIFRQVEADVTETIVPNIQEVIQMLLLEAGEEEFQYYGISQQPAQGYGERIFSLYDHRSQEEIARFDVRRDNRPRDGYWFHFHYHLSADNFEEHYQIGDVYWDKNTPPKWMSS